MEQWQQQAADRLRAAVPEADRARVTVTSVVATPYAEILDYARAHDVDLIVMGTHGRGGVSYMLLGSIAERIKRKIGWDPRYWHVPPEPFLRSFYSAQRTRLEQKMLMGKRQERKVR